MSASLATHAKLHAKLPAHSSSSSFALPFVWLALCASHIASPDRLAALEKMLLSWCAQSASLPLWISISYATEDLRAAGARLFAKFRAPKGVELVVLQNKTAKSQFQHYTGLVARFRAKFGSDGKVMRHTWLLFSDDDDTWHPQRARVYGHRLDSLGSAARRITETIIERSPPDSHEQQKEHKLMASNVKLLPEYHACAVRMAALAAFVDASQPLLLANNYADLFFVRFLLSPDENRVMGHAAVLLAESIGSSEALCSAVVKKRFGLRLLLDMEPSKPLYRYDGALTTRGAMLHNAPTSDHARTSPWERQASQLAQSIRARGTPVTLDESYMLLRLQMTSLACLALAAYHANSAVGLPEEMPFEWMCAFEARQDNNQQVLFGSGLGASLLGNRTVNETQALRQFFTKLMKEDPEWIAFRSAPSWPRS
jgi:hypothetical protein